jgi:hypothetical protein
MDSNSGLLVAILIVSLCTLLGRSGSDNSIRFKALERKLDLILERLGINPNEGVDSQILELVKAGRKIEAIRLYREQTGAGLKESKDYVEGL